MKWTRPLCDSGSCTSIVRIIPHSTQLSGGARHCSAKAPGGEDLEIQEPIPRGDCATFHFDPTLPGMLGATLIGHQVIPTVFPLMIPLVYCHIKSFQRASSVEKPWPGGEKRIDGQTAYPVAW